MTEAPRKILFVDDVDLMHAAADTAAEALGYEVIHAYNGAEALKHIHDPDIHVVITDIVMPVMNGIELCEKIRALNGYDDLPIVVLTAHDEKEIYDRCYKAGADYCTNKPGCLEEMTEIAERATLDGGYYSLKRLFRQHSELAKGASDKLSDMLNVESKE